MCSAPSPPKADPVKADKLRILLSRDKYDPNKSGSGGSSTRERAVDMLRRVQGSTSSSGATTSAGLAVV